MRLEGERRRLAFFMKLTDWNLERLLPPSALRIFDSSHHGLTAFAGARSSTDCLTRDCA
ncbi:MAG: hypothetical protein Cons2KO_10150 [Congregibacter sp.]